MCVNYCFKQLPHRRENPSHAQLDSEVFSIPVMNRPDGGRFQFKLCVWWTPPHWQLGPLITWPVFISVAITIIIIIISSSGVVKQKSVLGHRYQERWNKPTSSLIQLQIHNACIFKTTRQGRVAWIHKAVCVCAQLYTLDSRSELNQTISPFGDVLKGKNESEMKCFLSGFGFRVVCGNDYVFCLFGIL